MTSERKTEEGLAPRYSQVSEMLTDILDTRIGPHVISPRGEWEPGMKEAVKNFCHRAVQENDFNYMGIRFDVGGLRQLIEKHPKGTPQGWIGVTGAALHEALEEEFYKSYQNKLGSLNGAKSFWE